MKTQQEAVETIKNQQKEEEGEKEDTALVNKDMNPNDKQLNEEEAENEAKKLEKAWIQMKTLIYYETD